MAVVSSRNGSWQVVNKSGEDFILGQQILNDMNPIKLFVSVVLLSAFVAGIMALKQPEKPSTSKEVMMVNVLESVMPGGTGRSRMVITYPGGKQESFDLTNYYSMMGVNFSNIQSNDAMVTQTLNNLVKDGWKLIGVSSGGNNLYFTKYTLMRGE